MNKIIGGIFITKQIMGLSFKKENQEKSNHIFTAKNKIFIKIKVVKNVKKLKTSSKRIL